jgi:hypothetical protein
MSITGSLILDFARARRARSMSRATRLTTTFARV